MNESNDKALENALATFLAAPVHIWNGIYPGKLQERGRELYQSGELHGLRAFHFSLTDHRLFAL